MDKTPLIMVSIIAVLFMSGCEDNVEQKVYDSIALCDPKTDGCMVPAEEETLPREPLQEPLREPLQEPLQEPPEPSSIRASEPSLDPLRKALGDAQLQEPKPTFMDQLRQEKTIILFDADRTTGSIVMSALRMKLFIDNPLLEVDENAADLTETAIAKLKDHHLILLGNACNNDLIAALDQSSHSCEGTTKGRGIIRSYENDGKTILVIHGYDDEDTYSLQKMITEETIVFAGGTMEVIV